MWFARLLNYIQLRPKYATPNRASGKETEGQRKCAALTKEKEGQRTCAALTKEKEGQRTCAALTSVS
jgi:hypothetical protein